MNPNLKTLAKLGAGLAGVVALVVSIAALAGCEGGQSSLRNRERSGGDVDTSAVERPDIAEVLGTVSAFAQEAESDTVLETDSVIVTDRAILKIYDGFADFEEEKIPVPAIMGGVILSNIVCQLANRDDFYIGISVALFYNSEELRQEIFFSRPALVVAVKDVMRRYEFGRISLSSLRENLLAAFNDILKSGQLPRIEIREFRVLDEHEEREEREERERSTR